MKIQYVLGISLVLLFIQCEAPDTSAISSSNFFDTNAFSKTQQDSLTKAKVALVKSVVLNGNKESKTILTPNWGVELSELASANINRPAWADKYRVQESGDSTIYTLIGKEDLEVKKLSIQNKQNGIVIKVLKKVDNVLNQSQKEITYNSQEGFQIKSIRKTIGSSADTLEISGKFSTNGSF